MSANRENQKKKSWNEIPKGLREKRQEEQIRKEKD